jgi:hypothetical protein
MITKISGILPTSARIESANLKSEQSVRSGAPTIGQPTALAAERFSTIQKETVGGLRPTDIENTLNPTRPKSDESIVEDLSNRFFLRDQDEEALGSEAQRLSIRV